MMMIRRRTVTSSMYFHIELSCAFYIHQEMGKERRQKLMLFFYELLKKAPETPPLPIVKKQIFVLKVTGVFAEETPITVQCESDSTAKTIIQQVLLNAGKNVDQVDEYALIEESSQSTSGEEPVEQR
ncbi:unnamed protein product, partial [Cylicostephanus goldi]